MTRFQLFTLMIFIVYLLFTDYLILLFYEKNLYKLSKFMKSIHMFNLGLKTVNKRLKLKNDDQAYKKRKILNFEKLRVRSTLMIIFEC